MNLLWSSVVERRVETFRIVAELDVPGHVCAGVFPGGIDGAMGSLNFQRRIEGLGERIVET